MKTILAIVLMGLSVACYADTQTFRTRGTVTVTCPGTLASKSNIGGDIDVQCTSGAVVPPPAIPPVVAPISNCNSFPSVTTINASWPEKSQRFFTKQYGNFYANGALIFKFTPPANSGFRISFSEDGDGQRGYSTFRTGFLSTSPCNFIPATGAKQVAFGSTSFAIYASTEAQTTLRNAIKLNAGQTYYLTLLNQYNGQPSCGAEMCNGFFTIDILR